jgi:hypothetical protein
MTKRDDELLKEAFDGLEKRTAGRTRQVIHWLRDPNSRWVRLPLGILFIIGSFFWFLPVVGIEWLPIGLLLIAEEVPFLRRPAARMMLWLERRWDALFNWYRRRKSRSRSRR